MEMDAACLDDDVSAPVIVSPGAGLLLTSGPGDEQRDRHRDRHQESKADDDDQRTPAQRPASQDAERQPDTGQEQQEHLGYELATVRPAPLENTGHLAGVS